MAENLIEQFGTEFIWEIGDIKGYPVAIVERMLERQVEQGNERNVRVFERDRWAGKESAGFDWSKSKEGNDFWSPIITNQNFKGYFKEYPSAIASEEVEVKEEVKYTTIDEFIAYNQSELQDMEKNNPPVFDALNDVLAELRVAYEGAKPVKKKKKTVKKKTPKPKAVEEDIDLDSLMDDMDDSCELVIDDILCEIDDFELD